VGTDIVSAVEIEPADERLRDELTGLPNRALLLDRLGIVLVRRRRPRSDSLAVFSVDVDGMSALNTTYGREVGDAILCGCAMRLSELVRAGDVVARVRDDEFALLCEELSGEVEALVVAERIADGFERPLKTTRGGFTVGVTVGVVIVAGGAMEPERVLREAHRAMLRGRGAGGEGRFGTI
jgi:diguanylate cyclase (GGDEF)-like protein